MDKVKAYVGIDVSKGWLDFAVLSPGSPAKYLDRYNNTDAGIRKGFAAAAKATGVEPQELLFCLEHTGIYGFRLLEAAAKAGLLVWLESAMKIRKTQVLRGKSDEMDACRIAEYAYRFRDKARLWVREPDRITRLRDLLALRERLISARKALKVPKAEAAKAGKVQAVKDMAKFSDTMVKSLTKKVKALDKEIDALIAADLEFQRSLELACSVPSIGRMTALSLILYTRNFSLFDDPRKLACYAGVAPFGHSSGSSIRGRTRVSHLANKCLKRILHMAALSSVRNNPDMKAYFARRVAEGKNKMSVINAIRNKLLHCVMAVVKRQTPWTAEKSSKGKENFAAVG